MPKTKQLNVSVENRPGTLAHVAKVLGGDKVNILGFLSTTSGTQGSVHLVVDNVHQARRSLKAAGLAYTEADALITELPNKPGALARFAGRLAARDINIITGYQTSSRTSRKASVVFVVSKLE